MVGTRLLNQFIETISPRQSMEPLDVTIVCTLLFLRQCALWVDTDARALTGAKKHYSLRASKVHVAFKTATYKQ
jgi:hypothetical protein